MKENRRKDSGSKRRVIAAAALAGLLAAMCAGGFAFAKLRAIWLDQCVVTDAASEVSIADGKMVRSDVIREAFGLTNGANLARIDFASRRRELIERFPNIRDIVVSRHLPNRVSVEVEERVPVVRLGIKGRREDSGRVADTEGMVFISSSGTQMLPMIREPNAPGTKKGQRLEGMSLAALRLIETCRSSFPELALIEADVSNPDYITGVLARDSSLALIAWDGMREPSSAMMPGLTKQLTDLSRAVGSNVDPGIRLWRANIPGKPITGDTKRGFL